MLATVYSNDMQFVRASMGDGAKALGTRLTDELTQGKRVVWFFSGGSNIPITAEVMQGLSDDRTRHLTVMPIDERYGPVGHSDSNFAQLLTAGFVPKQAAFIPVLDGSDIETTTKRFSTNILKALERADVVLGQIGLGPDGHISGILPHSVAVTDERTAMHYQGPDYARITTTFPTLKRLNISFVFAYGENKRPALARLRDESVTLDEQPAQFLKTLTEVYVYNDQLEEREP